MTWMVAAGLAFGIAAVLTHLLARPGALRALVAHPNERSLHSHPTPASGGLAMAAALICALPVLHFALPALPVHGWFYLGAALVALISLWDDWRPLSPSLRLAIHLTAASCVLLAGWTPESLHWPNGHWPWPQWLAMPFTLLFVAWMTNLYNFMDGMDGFAGGMAVFGFGGYALLGWLGGAPEFAALNLLIVLAALGFLIFNFPPARIFMGDVGASTLGYLAAALGLWGEQLGLFPLWAAVLLFSPFIVDASVTLTRRAWRKERIWQAHKTHYYQRLVQMGWGHRTTVLAEYAIMVACLASTTLALRLPALGQWIVVLGWIVGYWALAHTVRRLEINPT